MEKVLIIAYSKNCNFLRFSLILQNFCLMICEIIFSRTVCGSFLIFYRLLLTNNLIEKNNFSKPYISGSTYFKKFLHTMLKIFSAQISWKDCFFKKYFFQWLGAFFKTAKPLILASFLFTKNFFQVWLFNFNTILKAYFKNLYIKTEEKWWFYSFN